jgi:hypothetical protein
VNSKAALTYPIIRTSSHESLHHNFEFRLKVKRGRMRRAVLYSARHFRKRLCTALRYSNSQRDANRLSIGQSL